MCARKLAKATLEPASLRPSQLGQPGDLCERGVVSSSYVV